MVDITPLATRPLSLNTLQLASMSFQAKRLSNSGKSQYYIACDYWMNNEVFYSEFLKEGLDFLTFETKKKANQTVRKLYEQNGVENRDLWHRYLKQNYPAFV